MSRAILPATFSLCVLLIVGCGGDSGTNPRPEPPRGFTAEYKRGAYLGDNMCRLNAERTGYEKIYDYELLLDWWTDDTTGVESVRFRCPFRVSSWFMGLCLVDSVGYGNGGDGDKEDGHWKKYWQSVGYIYGDPSGTMYLSVELCVEVGDSEDQPPFKALVSWSDGRDSLYECVPRER